MRAPIEDTIETLQQPEAQRTAEAPPKPFGGKALMRMISALDRRGFHELADSIVAEIVPGEAHEAVETARVQFSAAPPSLTEPQTAETRARPPKARARARRREDDTEKVRGDLSTIAAAIAETYLQTAARLKETTRALEAPASMPMATET